MTERRILSNRLRCCICGDIIESKFRHDFVKCSCGNAFVDGGRDYRRIGVVETWDSVEDLTEYTDAD